MKNCATSNNRHFCISWISFKVLLFYITTSHSIVLGQFFVETNHEYANDGDFTPSFGPFGSPRGLAPSKRAINNYGGGGFLGSDLQGSFFDLFDWNKEMPGHDIVNTFLEDEDELPILKELSDACPKSEFFFGANPSHMSVVMKIKNLLMEQRNARDAIMMAGSLRDKAEVNPNAWLRGVVAATMSRDDLAGLRKPAMVEVMPSLLIYAESIMDMKRQANVGSQSRTCVRVDGSFGRDNGIENALWYWREDIMVNSHHWYWHLTYPTVSNEPRKDRQGELFSYMHHTFLARYHAERLANGLAPILPLNLQRGTILREPYNPHFYDTNSGRDWTPRPPNVPLSDIMSNAIPGAFFISIDNRTIEQSNVLQGIAARSLVSSFGQGVSIADFRGIDVLGDVIEATQFTMNPQLYGYLGIHNAGHVLTSLVLDPFERQGLPPGVMGDTATAMRDVIFYPYHTFIDDIFDSHKRTLRPYTLSGGEWPLVWEGVEIHDIKVQSYQLPTNNLQTFWGERKFDLSRGLDFNRSTVQGPITTCVRHLDHQDFEYQISLTRQDFVRSSKATIRIFLAPRYSEKGVRYSLEEQRRRFFILDMFVVSLNVGKNLIRRRSDETTLTIDFPQSYRELQQDANLQTTYCGCGWPHHLLLPKGTLQGMPFDLFVMATNGKEDVTRQSGRPQVCRSAPIFCGIEGELYPDARPMGYPFDRAIYNLANNINPLDPAFDEVAGPITLEEWITEIPNSASTKVIVTHLDELRGDNPISSQPYSVVAQGISGNVIGPLLEVDVSSQGAPIKDPFQEHFGATPGLAELSRPKDFFSEFFPSTRPRRNHPKRFSPEIEPPAKEFLQFLSQTH